MKKTIAKLIGTILVITATVFTAIYLRNHFDIEQKMFFFCCMTISIIELFVVVAVFNNEIAQIKTFFTSGLFEEKMAKKIAEMHQKEESKKSLKKKNPKFVKTKKFIQKIGDNPIFWLITMAFTIGSFVLISYNFFFKEDLKQNLTLMISFFAVWVLTFICQLIISLASREARDIRNASIWGFILIIQVLNCL